MSAEHDALIKALRYVQKHGRPPASRRSVDALLDNELAEHIGGGFMDLTEKGAAMLAAKEGSDVG